MKYRKMQGLTAVVYERREHTGILDEGIPIGRWNEETHQDLGGASNGGDAGTSRNLEQKRGPKKGFLMRWMRGHAVTLGISDGEVSGHTWILGERTNPG